MARCHFLIPSLLVLGLFTVSASPAAPAPEPPSPAKVKAATEKRLLGLLKEKGSIADPRLRYAIYVKKVEGQTLISPILKHKNAEGQVDAVVTAREAELSVDVGKKLLLLRLKTGEGREGRSYIAFEDRTLEMPLPSDFLK
jgi:hypothetical protein